MLQDLRFTFRLMAKERWFSAVAILALALGIGVNAIGFTVVNAAFLRGLPYTDADRLFMLAWQTRSGGRVSVSHDELRDWRAQSRSFDGLAAFTEGSMSVSDDHGLPDQSRGSYVTANAFRVLGQPPLLGRDFAEGEDRPGAEPLAIIGNGLWKSRYGGDPNVLGKTLRVNGKRATIVGVMPARMQFPVDSELWTLAIPTDGAGRDARTLSVFGRLREGTALAGARVELNGIAERLAAAYPDVNKDFVGVRVETFSDRFIGGKARRVFPLVMGAVCFVLLIACANVANLMLSRSAYRAREIAVRTALGATRWRIVRQLLLESLVLGIMGGAIGLMIAIAGARLIETGLQSAGKPFWLVFSVDGAVIAYVTALCMVTAVVFGLAPALHVSKTNLNDVMKEGGRGAAGNRRVRWLSGSMIVTEMALTIVLLAGAGLMIRSFMKIDALDTGIRKDHVTTMRMELKTTKYATADARRDFFARLEPGLSAIPGVESMAFTTAVPPFGAGQRLVEIEGTRVDGTPPSVSTVTVSPQFFSAAGVSLVRGRGFRETDGAPGLETVIVNERLVARLFNGEDPVGKRLRFVPRPSARPATSNTTAPVWRTIVGVSPSVRQGSFEDGQPNAVAYIPYRQEPPEGGWIMIRSQLPPGSVMDAVRRGVQAIDQDQPVFTIQTVDQMVTENYTPLRVFGTLFVVLGAIALVLSSVGLYGVMAYSVTQRTQEIGVRMALGAGSRHVSWMVLKRGLVQLALGLVIGLAGAFATSRALGSVLVQVAPTDPVTFIGITILLSAVSIAACLLPARRATQVDPLVALRAD